MLGVRQSMASRSIRQLEHLIGVITSKSKVDSWQNRPHDAKNDSSRSESLS
ncbi:LysR family transcriptional regulator [Bradyrhizobium sp.]|uniref:LysR family transcriptional regulator n=1 Tax=Bradyrhizobium denitrificans TaxID=2734912 RepID=A0ABS5G1W1_9BRAD|nr:LysR family transcriptional regulator [Bradyrhizobium denitrificans]NPU24490.1 LysR family transcriptional regulator [Bradyrhizobium sp. LMG 8443]